MGSTCAKAARRTLMKLIPDVIEQRLAGIATTATVRPLIALLAVLSKKGRARREDVRARLRSS